MFVSRPVHTGDELEYVPSPVRWANCRTFQWQFICSIWDECQFVVSWLVGLQFTVSFLSVKLNVLVNLSATEGFWNQTAHVSCDEDRKQNGTNPNEWIFQVTNIELSNRFYIGSNDISEEGNYTLLSGQIMRYHNWGVGNGVFFSCFVCLEIVQNCFFHLRQENPGLLGIAKREVSIFIPAF